MTVSTTVEVVWTVEDGESVDAGGAVTVTTTVEVFLTEVVVLTLVVRLIEVEVWGSGEIRRAAQTVSSTTCVPVVLFLRKQSPTLWFEPASLRRQLISMQSVASEQLAMHSLKVEAWINWASSFGSLTKHKM